MKNFANILKNENVRKGLTNIYGTVKKVSEVTVPILGVMLIKKLSENTGVRDICEYVETGHIGYDDAADAIANSYMCSSDKAKAMSALKIGKPSEYYGAVISIVDSYMCSSDKVKAIENMSEN